MKVTIDVVLEEYEKLLAKGTCYIWQDVHLRCQFPILSGGYGRGYLDLGDYSIRGLITPDKIEKMSNPKPYQTDGYGFAFPMTPLFETNRTGIWMHPDGNIPGSLGCVVWTEDKKFNENLYELVKVALSIQGTIPVNVRDTITKVSI